MATTTPNYGLRKPTNADTVNVALDISGNMDLLDAHAHSGTYVPATVAVGTGIDPTGVADSTTALQAKITAAAGGLLFIPAGTYKVSSTLDVSSNTTIVAYGATIDVLDDGSAAGRMFRLNSVSNVRIYGLKITSSNAAARTQLYGPLALFGGTDVRLIDVEVASSAGVGIYVQQTQRLWITRAHVHGTYADGIHVSRGAQDVWITDPHVYATGDDAIAVVSYNTHSQITRVAIINPVVRDLVGSLGSGIALVGPKHVTVVGGVISSLAGTVVSGVKVVNDNVAGTHTPNDVNVIGTHVRAVSRGFSIGTSSDVLLSGVSATACTDSGAQIIGATRAVISSGKFNNNTAFGVYDDGAAGGGHIIGCDLRNNGSGPYGGSPATVSSCITSSGVVIDGGDAS